MKIKPTFFALCLIVSSLALEIYGKEKGVQIEYNIPLEQLTERMNAQIMNRRFPQAAMRDNYYLVISFFSPEITKWQINCAEIYYDANELGVALILSWHTENPFVQVVAQTNNDYFTVIRLRRFCIEAVEPEKFY